jgi:Raf kinase inhibitor-like YbhB/YbcL family protein
MQTRLSVESAAFAQGGAIPRKFTADGANLSPPLSWSAGPAGTQSYALVMDDPDAPGGAWVHWVMWNLRGNELDENVSRDAPALAGAVQGRTSWRRTGYGGPSPPSGTHRYRFRVHALDTCIDLGPGAGVVELERAIGGHELASGELVGRYSRDE